MIILFFLAAAVLAISLSHMFIPVKNQKQLMTINKSEKFFRILGLLLAVLAGIVLAYTQAGVMSFILGFSTVCFSFFILKKVV